MHTVRAVGSNAKRPGLLSPKSACATLDRGRHLPCDTWLGAKAIADAMRESKVKIWKFFMVDAEKEGRVRSRLTVKALAMEDSLSRTSVAV